MSFWTALKQGKVANCHMLFGMGDCLATSFDVSFISFYIVKVFSESVTPSCLLVSPVLTFCMVLYDNNLNSCQVVFFEFNWCGISLCLLKEFHLLNKDFWFNTTDLGTNTCCYTPSLVTHSCHICVVQWMLTSCTLSCTVNFTETITALCHYVICCPI